MTVIKAALWDLDGTTAKTQTEFHARAEALVLRKYGVVVKPEDISSTFAGIHTLQVFKALAPELDSHMLLKEKWECMYALAKQEQIRAMEHAKEIIELFHQCRFRLAIASASPIEWIRLCLNHTDLDRFFLAIASVDEVPRGKPAPDVFLLAAERLQVDPHECVVIEDGFAGVMAGINAGMETYWLTQSQEAIQGATNIATLRDLKWVAYRKTA